MASRVLEAAPTTQSGQPIAVGAGAVPPPDAPHEVASGVDAASKVVPDTMQGNEQALAPLRAGGVPLTGKALVAAVGPVRATLIEAARVRATSPPSPSSTPPVMPRTPTAAGLRTVSRRPAVTAVAVDAIAQEAVVGSDDAGTTQADDAGTATIEQTTIEPPPLAPILPHMRAASDTDTPSRGLPRGIADPGKQITGGFGDLGEAQYFPLDGSELRQLVDGLLSELHARIQDDLRFSIGITYPRVRARVEIVIEGMAADAGFAIPRVAPVPAAGTPGSTPLAIARAHGDEIVFVVTALRQEFDEAGASITPPDAIREELGIVGPRKQRVTTPTGSVVVDVVQ